MLPVILIASAALVTSIQMGTAHAGANECPAGYSIVDSSKKYAAGCTVCVADWQIGQYPWQSWSWSCTNGVNYKYDSNGQCLTCK
jgi:hypothetical protein